VCSVPLELTADPGAGRAKSSTQRLRAKEVKGAEVTSVNMHRLGESFVEKVSDVRRRVTAGENIFFIPEVHFAGEKPMLADDDGWWYQVRSVIWCRACRKCRVRKEQGGFMPKEWNKKQLATCTECDRKKGVTRVSSTETSKVRKRVKHSSNPQARIRGLGLARGFVAENRLC